MKWALKRDDTSTKRALFEFISKYAENVEWTNYDKSDFSRTISFIILGKYYEIRWYHNECHLYAGKYEERPLQASFDTIYTDICYPCHHAGNDNLTFAYKGNDILRLPLEGGYFYNKRTLEAQKGGVAE